MIFSLDVRRARKGDCLLLHFGKKSAPGLAVIDGGPSKVYGPHLKPRLLEIKKARDLDDSKPLPLDLVMVSHVDDDHIKGILDLTGELTAGIGAPLVRVRKFWHNSFSALIDGKATELLATFTAAFGAASLGGGLSSDATVDSAESEDVVSASLKVLASIEQGARLQGEARRLGFPHNPEYDGKVVIGSKTVRKVAEGLMFVVAGPMKPELTELRSENRKWLAAQKKKKRAPEAALAAYVDKSVANLASIVVLATSGGKSILLTGDARGDKILEGLETVGLLKPGKSMHVDILKVPHHGSANNLERAFFERVTADHYVFSGDGEHGNPEREALEMLVLARKKKPMTIHLTYPIDVIDAARKLDWNEQQAKEKKKKAAGGKKKPRENWSASKHGVGPFLDAKLAAGQKIKIVDAKKPHVIDLLDPLGF